jgi:hypothetical protein
VAAGGGCPEPPIVHAPHPRMLVFGAVDFAIVLSQRCRRAAENA